MTADDMIAVQLADPNFACGGAELREPLEKIDDYMQYNLRPLTSRST